MTRATAILVAAALALAGCGGGSSGASDQVKSTVQSYIDAFVKGDGAKACSLMSDATRTQFVARVKLLTKTSDCAKAIQTIRAAAGAATTDALSKVKLTDVKVNGSTATVKLSSGANASTAHLQKQGGSWKVAGVPGTQ
jgi:spermidine/putrescine-binding protein